MVIVFFFFQIKEHKKNKVREFWINVKQMIV